MQLWEKTFALNFAESYVSETTSQDLSCMNDLNVIAMTLNLLMSSHSYRVSSCVGFGTEHMTLFVC